VGPYGEAKIQAEQVCLAFRAKGVCVPILRPKSFVGPERLGVFEMLYDWAWDGRNFPVLGSGDNRYQLLDVEDLCRAIYLCATADRNLVNDTFNVGAETFGTMREDFQAVLDRAGRGGRIIGVPARPVIWALKLLERARLSPLYRWVYETAAKDSFVATERIRARLGFVPAYSNREALIRNYDWYMANRDRIRDTSGISHRVPWKQGILRLAKRFF
jgi:nucleoside-diphosphate-sugar epimerase